MFECVINIAEGRDHALLDALSAAAGSSLRDRHADTFHHDLHKDLRADYILANPPFNVSDWGGDRLREDARWKYGTPPVGNANFAWVQHMISKLAPNGLAGFVLANGSMSSNQSGEGEIRKAIIEADLVDCMIALPGQLFYTTPIPACLWFLTRSKTAKPFRHRSGETLFIDARKLGVLTDRTHRDLADTDLDRIAAAYHAWRGEKKNGDYSDVPGFCKSASKQEIAEHGFVLSPGRYVGAEDVEDDAEPFADKMKRLVAKLEEQFAQRDAGLKKLEPPRARQSFEIPDQREGKTSPFDSYLNSLNVDLIRDKLGKYEGMIEKARLLAERCGTDLKRIRNDVDGDGQSGAGGRDGAADDGVSVYSARGEFVGD